MALNYMSSLESYGIVYSDSHEIDRVSPAPGDKSFRTHIFRIYQFHQTPVAIFAYDCVSAFSLNTVNKTTFFSFTTSFFF